MEKKEKLHMQVVKLETHMTVKQSSLTLLCVVCMVWPLAWDLGARPRWAAAGASHGGARSCRGWRWPPAGGGSRRTC
jgi:hypothetical protein